MCVESEYSGTLANETMRQECLLVLLVNVVKSFDDFFQDIGETFN